MEMPEQSELEKFIHAQLQRLPERAAPEHLITHVMAALAAREKLPWWKQSFTHWPRHNQIFLFAVLTAIFGGVVYATRRSAEAVTLPHLVEHASSFAWFARMAESLADSVLLIARSIPLEWLGGIAVIFCVMYAACVATGVALYKVATGSSSSSAA